MMSFIYEAANLHYSKHATSSTTHIVPFLELNTESLVLYPKYTTADTHSKQNFGRDGASH